MKREQQELPRYEICSSSFKLQKFKSKTHAALGSLRFKEHCASWKNSTREIFLRGVNIVGNEGEKKKKR